MIKFVELKKFYFSDNSQDVYLSTGAPVIAIKNCKGLGLINGEKFNIKDISSKFIEVTNTRITISIPIDKFQELMHVAYCITAHKSQGLTISEPYTIHDYGRMSKECKYVALSRGDKWENVNIIF